MKRIGYGKTSVVYKANFRPTGRVVAVKQYQRRLLSPLNYRQLEREVSIHAFLQHEHVLDFYFAFEDAASVYLVMEFCEKGDLFVALQQGYDVFGPPWRPRTRRCTGSPAWACSRSTSRWTSCGRSWARWSTCTPWA